MVKKGRFLQGIENEDVLFSTAARRVRRMQDEARTNQRACRSVLPDQSCEQRFLVPSVREPMPRSDQVADLSGL